MKTTIVHVGKSLSLAAQYRDVQLLISVTCCCTPVTGVGVGMNPAVSPLCAGWLCAPPPIAAAAAALLAGWSRAPLRLRSPAPQVTGRSAYKAYVSSYTQDITSLKLDLQLKVYYKNYKNKKVPVLLAS